MRVKKQNVAKVIKVEPAEAARGQRQEESEEEEEEDEDEEKLLQCIMCNCMTIEEYLKRHIRYNHLISKDEIVDKLYSLHYPSQAVSVATQTEDRAEPQEETAEDPATDSRAGSEEAVGPALAEFLSVEITEERHSPEPEPEPRRTSSRHSPKPKVTERRSGRRSSPGPRQAERCGSQRRSGERGSCTPPPPGKRKRRDTQSDRVISEHSYDNKDRPGGDHSYDKSSRKTKPKPQPVAEDSEVSDHSVGGAADSLPASSESDEEVVRPPQVKTNPSGLTEVTGGEAVCKVK